MGATPINGFPYPDGSGLVIDGDDAIEALALAVEARLQGIYAHNTITSGPVAAGTSLRGFAAPAGSGHFSQFASDLQYAGPTRTYVVEFQLEVYHGGLPFDLRLDIRLNGVNYATTNVKAAHTGTEARVSPVVKLITPLTTGDYLQFATTLDVSANIQRGRYSVLPIPIGA